MAAVKLIASLTLLIATLGCSTKVQQEPRSNAVAETKRNAEGNASKGANGLDGSVRYTIVDFWQKNVPDIGVQHRYPRVVLPNPKSKEDVVRALKVVYSFYKQDIEKTQPEAQCKRISILLYDSTADAEDHDGWHICHVLSSKVAGPSLPDWDNVITDWKWRHPEYRPSEQQLRIYRDYWHGLKRASEIAEAPFYDANGFFVGELQDQPVIDRRKKEEVIKLVADLCDRNNMTQTEMERLVAYVWSWRLGEKPTDERIEEWAKSFREDWTE